MWRMRRWQTHGRFLRGANSRSYIMLDLGQKQKIESFKHSTITLRTLHLFLQLLSSKSWYWSLKKEQPLIKEYVR
eukprot:UN23515